MSFKWLLPWNWGSLALRIVGFALLVGALHFFILPWYYNKDLKEREKKAAEKANVAKLERESLNYDRTIKAINEQIKTLETIAASGERIADASQRLQQHLRASEAARTELSACLQRANTLDTVQRSISEFAGRVAQEADRHVADKVACHAAWPK